MSDAEICRGQEPVTAVVSAVQGDLVRQLDCDAIVNSANPYLIAGSGVSGAIYKAAGPELEPYTRKLAPLALGQAVASPGYNLTARWIIHTRGPRFLVDPDPPRYLAQALANAISLADQLGVKRLAVPAISMGVYGYPPEEAIPILVGQAGASAERVVCLEEIRFVLVGDRLHRAFEAGLSEYRGSRGSNHG